MRHVRRYRAGTAAALIRPRTTPRVHVKLVGGRWKMATKTGPVIDIGIEKPQRKAIATGLAALMADTYTLYLKTHNFHWNVTGPMFETLHLMFERHYNELWVAVDVIAERIRTLGFPTPGTYTEFSQLSSIKDTRGVPVAEDMVRALVEGHETVSRTARKLVPAVEKADDQATLDLLTQRMQSHEKTAWMLRSLLE